MKGRLMALLCLSFVLFFCQQAWGAGFGTPVLDGSLDACYGTAEATDQSGDGNGNAVMDLLELYVCNDANYWYFYFTINGDIGTSNWGKYVIYIDTTNDANGATSDAWGRSVVVTDPHKPEFGLYTWVDALPYDPSDTQVHAWTGSSWSSAGTLDGVGRSAGSISALEWKIAKTTLGSPTQIWCEVWSTGGGTSDNAQDTINDPAEDWNATDWSSLATLLNSTNVPETAGGDTDPPTVVGASSHPAPHNTIEVEFNEFVDLTTSQVAGNYTVNSGAVTVVSATRGDPDSSKVTLTLGSNLPFGGSNDVLVVNVQDIAGNPIVNNGTTNVACFCLSQVIFEVHMNLHLRTHSIPPIDTVAIEGNVYPLTWDPTCDMYARDNGVPPDVAAGDSIYTVAVDFSRPSDCATGTDTTWVEFEYTHQCSEWEGGHHYYADPGLTCGTGVDTFSVWWADVAPDDYTTKPIDVIFHVDMSSLSPGALDTVGLNGSQYPLNWNVPPTTFLADDGVFPDSFPADDHFAVRVRFPVNTWKWVEYKYLFNSAYECSLAGNRDVFLNDAVYDTVGVNPLILPLAEWEDYCTVGIIETPETRAFKLDQNAPNPFNPVTTFRFTLPKAAHTMLTVYDASGRVVRTLVDERLDQGPHEMSWNGTGEYGSRVASGVYFYELKSEGMRTTRKLVIVY
ncbi:MAG: T9SS type A sorting domain-containing protein [Candidatus Eiseniibacteriota bacterium]|nr:MAG: T9SS type A sorting domain-containing protein [Candidatus Eisenbacteria bacterium]